MNDTTKSERRFLPSGNLLIAAWVITLLVSELPDIILHYLQVPEPGWLLWGKIGFLAMCLALSLAVKALRRLWQFLLVFLGYHLLFSAAADWFWQSDWFQAWLSRQDSWAVRQFADQLKEMGVTALMLLLMWVIQRKPARFFLAKGQLDAPLEPVRWLGIKTGESWKKFGWIFSAVMMAGALTFLLIYTASAGLLGKFSQIIPLLPVVLLFAALNGFSEEMTMRAPLLATTHEVIGKPAALWITSIFFGLAHWLNGSPPGAAGFLMTGLVAYLYGKSMIETRGMFWAWLMHFLSDIPIFIMLALMAV